jgi:glutaredoxin
MLTIYSKENCPFCTRVKLLLDEKGVKYTDIRVDLLPEARQFVLDAGHRSVPQIYKDGKLFVENGYAGLAKLNDLDFQQLKENV